MSNSLHDNNERSGKTLMIAGGTDGIGFSLLIAECCSQERNKYSTIYVLGRNFRRVRQELHNNSTTPQRIIELGCDITKPEDLTAAIAQIDDKEIHDFVLTIGTFCRGKISDMKSDDIEPHFHLNCISNIQLLRSIVAKLKPAQSQILVCTASLALGPARSPYALQSATKSALRSFVAVLREELRGKTRVMNLMPPSVQTEIFAKAGDNRSTADYPPPSRVAHTIQFMLDCPFDICVPEMLIEQHCFDDCNTAQGGN